MGRWFEGLSWFAISEKRLQKSTLGGQFALKLNGSTEAQLTARAPEIASRINASSASESEPVKLSAIERARV